MRHAFRALVLSAAVAALVGSGELPTAPAQQKDKDKEKKADDKKPDDKKADEAVGKVEVYKAKDGWRFKVLNTNGKSIAGGYIPHEKKEDAIKEVELLKTTLMKGKVEVKDDKKDASDKK